MGERKLVEDLLAQCRSRRGDELSRSLFRQRARLMAVAELELAVEDSKKRRSVAPCHQFSVSREGAALTRAEILGGSGGTHDGAEGQKRSCSASNTVENAQLAEIMSAQDSEPRGNTAARPSPLSGSAAKISPFVRPARQNSTLENGALAAATPSSFGKYVENAPVERSQRFLASDENERQRRLPSHSPSREDRLVVSDIPLRKRKPSPPPDESVEEFGQAGAGQNRQCSLHVGPKGKGSQDIRSGEAARNGSKRPPSEVPLEASDLACAIKNKSSDFVPPAPSRETASGNDEVCATAQANTAGLLPPLAGAAIVGAATKILEHFVSLGNVTSFEGEERRKVIARSPDFSRGEQPAFVVLGLVGQNAERVLLLPTSARRHETVGSSPAQSVVLEWDGDNSILLTRTKIKPTVPNPLPALATVLAWARDLGPDALPTKDLPTLPRNLAPTPFPAETLDNGGVSNAPAGLKPPATPVNSLEPELYDNADGNGKAGRGSPGVGDVDGLSPISPFLLREGNRNSNATQLSIGAAWMLSHVAFGQHAGGKRIDSFLEGHTPYENTLSIAGSETSALSLLSCPDVGWAPEPSEVMQALVEGRGNVCGYTVAAPTLQRTGRDVGGGEANAGGTCSMKASGGEAQAACNELLAAGVCVLSDDGGRLTLVPKVELAFGLTLKVFLHRWNPTRMALAQVALGLGQTGPTTMAVLPCSMYKLLAVPLRVACTDGCVLREAGIQGAERSAICSHLSGRVAKLCVKLHTWWIGVSREVGSAGDVEQCLFKVVKVVTAAENPKGVWNGPMAEALAMLGGGGRGWMARMSRCERLLDPACARLQEAVANVAEAIANFAAMLQKKKAYGKAVVFLRLLLSQDQDQAGYENRSVPDLAWAASWCTARLRGWAWIRLAMNLEHLRDGGGCLEALRSACEDGLVGGGERVAIRQRLAAKHQQYGDPDDTPPASPFPEESEEQLVTHMKVGKEGNKRNPMGGRILFFDHCDAINPQKLSARKRRARSGSPANSFGMTVEELVLKDRREQDGWAGVHCETDLVMMLMMLLLWEEVFDPNVKAAVGHCLTNQPLDLYDMYFWTRRKGLPGRLATIGKCSDEELWTDVGQRYDRYKGVACSRCDWNMFSKQQIMEVAVAFGGRRLSYVLKELTRDLGNLNFGFPDLVLWRPTRQRRGYIATNPRITYYACAGDPGTTMDDKVEHGGEKCRGVSRATDRGEWAGKEFGLGWQGEGEGWEAKVVEVKSVSDHTSMTQRAWLRALRDAGVPAVVCRVRHQAQQKKGRKRPARSFTVKFAGTLCFNTVAGVLEFEAVPLTSVFGC